MNLSKEVTVNDLQKQIKETQSEFRSLKQELTILRVDYDLLNRRVQCLENTSHQSNEDSPSDEEDSNSWILFIVRVLYILGAQYVFGLLILIPEQCSLPNVFWAFDSCL